MSKSSCFNKVFKLNNDEIALYQTRVHTQNTHKIHTDTHRYTQNNTKHYKTHKTYMIYADIRIAH